MSSTWADDATAIRPSIVGHKHSLPLLKNSGCSQLQKTARVHLMHHTIAQDAK